MLFKLIKIISPSSNSQVFHNPFLMIGVHFFSISRLKYLISMKNTVTLEMLDNRWIYEFYVRYGFSKHRLDSSSEEQLNECFLFFVKDLILSFKSKENILQQDPLLYHFSESNLSFSVSSLILLRSRKTSITEHLISRTK